MLIITNCVGTQYLLYLTQPGRAFAFGMVSLAIRHLRDRLNTIRLQTSQERRYSQKQCHDGTH